MTPTETTNKQLFNPHDFAFILCICLFTGLAILFNNYSDDQNGPATPNQEIITSPNNHPNE